MGSLKKLAAAAILTAIEDGNQAVEQALKNASADLKDLVAQAKAAKLIKNPKYDEFARAQLVPLSRVVWARRDKWEGLVATLEQRLDAKKANPLSAEERQDLGRTMDKANRAVGKYELFAKLADDLRRYSAMQDSDDVRKAAVLLCEQTGILRLCVRRAQVLLRDLER